VIENDPQTSLLINLIEHLPMALFAKDYTDDVGVFVTWNGYSQELFGLYPEQVLGKSDFDLFPEEQARFFQEKDLETLEAGKTVHIPKEIVSSPRGDKYVSTWKIPVLSGDKGGRLLMGVSLDITENVELEKQLSLELAKNVHSAKLLSLGEMAAGIAHEVNNPLAIIAGSHELLLKRPKDKPIPFSDFKNMADVVSKNVQRISNIIGVLRKFSRNDSLTSGDAQRVRDIVEDSVALCRSKIEGDGIEFQSYVADDSLEIFAKGTQISQVLVNLLNNAADAVTGMAKCWVRLEVVQQQGQILFSVTDSGSRITEDLEKKLFEPFFTTKAVGEGTGLGLSISKSIAEDHSGQLFLDRECPNTKFTLKLPIRKP